MDIVTIDFETYYDKEYSLSKMTTEAYIRDPRFEIIGVAIKVNDYPADWYSGSNPGKFLRSLDYSKRAVLCHNTAFDGAILSWLFNIKPRLWLDTLSMARPAHNITVGGSLANLAAYYGLGDKGTEVVAAIGKRRCDFTEAELNQYGQYCINDVELTKALFDKLKVGFPVSELLVIDQTLRMYTEPQIILDTALLQQHLVEVRQRKTDLLASVNVTADDIMSNAKFANALLMLDVKPPRKISPRTGKETFAFAKTDNELTELLNHPDERVVSLISARLGIKSTIEETRTESLIGVASRGPLPIMLNYYGAHTGRFSGGDKLNLQNLPARSGSNAIRRSLQAPEGHVLVACDSSQIEARMVAYIAGQDDLVEAFRNKRDVYSEFATEVYGRKITKADVVERFVGKTCISEGTLVLSDSGWKPIEQVSLEDRLWDGEEWVCHQGLLNNGIKPTLNLCGVWLTPDHQVWSGTQWLEAQSVVSDDDTLSQALGVGAANLPSQAMYEAQDQECLRSLSSVTVIKQSTPLTSITSKISKALAALFAPRKQQMLSGTGPTQMQCHKTNTGRGYLTGCLLPLPVAIPQAVNITSIMEEGASQFVMRGETIKQHFLPMFSRLTGGINRTLKWIGLMSMETTNRAISGLSQEAITYETNEKSLILKRVYDILNSGSRNRFTILTEAGPLVVHNCILGLGYGMGAGKLQRTLELGQNGINVKIDLAEASRIVRIYREKNFKIVQFWRKCDYALAHMIASKSGSLHDVLAYDGTGIKLPNNFRIHYPHLQFDGSSYRYVSDSRTHRKVLKARVLGEVVDSTEWTSIYGGKVTENIVQALAALVIREQMAAIGKHYRVAFQVHDEIIIAAPDELADDAQRHLETVMSTPPKWAPDLPIACESGYAKNYGDIKK